jgi:glutaredoxin
MKPIQITLYRFAGSWGPFSIKIPCGECAITQDILLDVMANELSGIPVELKQLDWLSKWWQPLWRGAWHAPIVLVENKIVSQGEAVNRGAVCQAVIAEYVKRSEIENSIVFGKNNCPHCQRAKTMLAEAKIEYTYMDVVKNARALYEIFPRAKKHLGNKTPITVPQIWLDGKYIGGADQLALHLGK